MLLCQLPTTEVEAYEADEHDERPHRESWLPPSVYAIIGLIGEINKLQTDNAQLVEALRRLKLEERRR